MGYHNVDVRAPGTFLAKDRPDLVEKYSAEDSDYYARHKDKTIEMLRAGPSSQEYVCDEYGSFADLPGSTWSLDEVLARHVFEHLSFGEARKALDEIDRKMKPGGILRIDVPDHEETLKLFQKTGDKFYIRHLLGPRRTEYGYHMMSYTRESLKKIVEQHGFRLVAEEPNIHIYPSFCLRFAKPGMRNAFEYFAPELEKATKGCKRLLEVGPGRYPWPAATEYMDVSENHLNDITKNVPKNIFNLNEKWQGGQIADFVYSSHVIEHLDDLEQGLRNLEKMAPRGVLVAPTGFKDFMFNFDEEDHRWWFIPDGAKYRAIRSNQDWMNKMRLPDMQKALCRILRSGPNALGEDQRILRNWFYDHEPTTDLFIYWEKKIEGIVL